MVYGLNIVPEHGYYVNVEMVGGNPSAIHAIDQEPDGGVSFRGVTSGRRCHLEHFPTTMRWLDRQGHSIPDFDQAELLNVSERARNLIEQFEPGVHQFMPVDYVDANNKFLEKRYFWVVGNRLDSIDRERTIFILRKGRVWRPLADFVRKAPEDIPPHIDPNIESKSVFNLSQIGKAHAWRDKHMDIGGMWLSTALADALKEAGLTGLQLSDNGLEAV
jgi:hypothetical protein